MHGHVKLSYYALTQGALFREQNEDAYLITDRFFAVCDGMGGHNGAHIASSTAISQLKQKIPDCLHPRQTLIPLTQSCVALVEDVSAHLWSLSNTNTELKGLGSTLVAALFDGRFLIHIHAGDSRLYRLRSNQLDLLTRDHAPKTHNGRIAALENRLTKVLGGQSTLAPTVGYQVAFPEDRFLLCTDGISSYLGANDIKKCLLAKTLQNAAENLLKNARRSNSQDDATVVLIQVEYPDI